MRICDRCRMPDPRYSNYYIGGKNRDICECCVKEYEKLEEVIESMEKTFMKNNVLKDIHFYWEKDVRRK